MSGVRQEGVLLVDDIGAVGIDVTIVGPLGQDVEANSIPVVLASNQSPLPINSPTSTRINLLSASGSASSSGNNTCVTPTSGKKLEVSYLSYNPSAAVESAFRFGAAGSLMLRNSLVTGGSVIAKDFGDFRCILGATNEALILNLGAAVPTIWNVFYREID